MNSSSNLQPIRVCSICQHYNPANAVLCAQCGEPLTPPTRAITDSLPDSLPTQITSIANSDRGTVSLYVQGHNEPIAIEDKAHIVIGRRKTPDDDFVTVDLTPVNALKFGVSRRHAVIHIEDGGVVTIEDLNSTNGTFVNDVRTVAGQRTPLRSDDEIRLGKLVIRFVYYFPPA
ncbi:MAG: FHA domain-containing protein [Anaerolineae bacterium]|nr:FHA domain-containing protein [Anaerolineae bacterium]